MNDEYILNYLEKNYALNGNKVNQKILFDSEIDDVFFFTLVDIYTGQGYCYDKLKTVIFKIFSNDKSFDKWFDKLNKHGNKIKKIYFENICYDKSCDELILDAEIYFEEQKIFGDTWIKQIVTDLYLKNVIAPKLKGFITPLCTRFQSKPIIKKAIKHFKVSKCDSHKSFITKIVLDLYTPHLEPKIIKHLDKMNIDAGSIILFGKLTRSFKNEDCIFDSKYTNMFKDFYYEKIEKNVYDYIASLDKNNVTSCNKIKVNYPRYNLELIEYLELVIGIINKWYNENILDVKIDDFLSQLIIKLGQRNWNIYWIGHGLLDEIKMMAHFKEENPQKSHIQIKYDNWYEEAVIKACEKELKIN